MSVTILLADDHRMLREGLRLILERQPHFRVVGEADTGRAAVEQAGRLQPSVVILDIGMPDLNGVETTRRIREGSPRTRVIALSEHADRRCVLAMLESGASGYVLKSAAGDELICAVQHAMRDQRYLSPDLTGTVVKEYLDRMTPVGPKTATTLAPRERAVLQLIAEGKTSKQVAAQLLIAVKTVDMHRQNIMHKLDLHSVAELTKYAIREGLTRLDA